LMVRYELAGPSGAIDVVSVHLETVREALDEVLHRAWRGAQGMRNNIAQRRFESGVARAYALDSKAPFIVVGDFNMPVESAIYREFWGSFTNAFSAAGFGLGYTKQTSYFGIRIDHVLLGPGWKCLRAWVGSEGAGYDHLPMITDVGLASDTGG
jgi:vancomycin resistance protein VanJ